MLLQTLVPLLVIPLILSSQALGYSFDDVKIWCSKTPHPEPCEHFLSIHPPPTPINQNIDFFKILATLTLERAHVAHSNVISLGSRCQNPLEKAAWSDCLELYQNTILKLNKTLDPNSKVSQVDAQTWLSTALTNIETCKMGFYDLGVSDNVLPSNNVSKLIRNTLSVNKVPLSNEPNNKKGFPTWVKPGDRKLLQSLFSAARANAVVAADGSGRYKTIKDAINAASTRKGNARYIIHVKAGVYNEQVVIKSKNIMIIGDGMGKTIITGSKSVGGGSTTFASATVAAVGDGFIARDITIRNTAGPSNHQAVALRSGSDLSVFYRCSFEGFQDTLYAHSDRQFYRECNIYGTVDFIFGNAAVVFQNCNIFARNPPNKVNTVTAQGRMDPNQNTGISIHNSRITAASDLTKVQSSVKTYLGRPWKEYSRTVVMKTYMDNLIAPSGWLEWNGNFALRTLYYGEYLNSGPGSSTANRVKWRGYHVITNAAEASKFIVGNLIAGTSWLPNTAVPFTSGL